MMNRRDVMTIMGLAPSMSLGTAQDMLAMDSVIERPSKPSTENYLILKGEVYWQPKPFGLYLHERRNIGNVCSFSHNSNATLNWFVAVLDEITEENLRLMDAAHRGETGVLSIDSNNTTGSLLDFRAEVSLSSASFQAITGDTWSAIRLAGVVLTRHPWRIREQQTPIT
jgi:hypothetical protein